MKQDAADFLDLPAGGKHQNPRENFTLFLRSYENLQDLRLYKQLKKKKNYHQPIQRKNKFASVSREGR